MDLISVIVPIYNVEPYLDRCVESIVNQTYPNLEIILVDDGSPDCCPAMCDAWAKRDSRVRVIHKKNGGLSDARNAGLAVAQGEYIAFVDSDDWIDARYIHVLYQALLQTNSEIAACDVCITFEKVKERCLPESVPMRVCTSSQAIEDILNGKGFRAVAWNKLYKRSLLIGEQYPVGRYHEDEFITYRLLSKADKLVYLDWPLYFYFQRSGSIMNSFSPKHLDVLDAYLERLTFLRESFPELYLKDKITFCISCTCIYREVLKQKNADRLPMKKRIKNSRKKVHFTYSEFRQLTCRERLYVSGSGTFMDIFCKLLDIQNGVKYPNA